LGKGGLGPLIKPEDDNRKYANGLYCPSYCLEFLDGHTEQDFVKVQSTGKIHAPLYALSGKSQLFMQTNRRRIIAVYVHINLLVP
jgi:hypothetical protein